MKPTVTTNRNHERFPITDYSYHSVALDGFNGGCAKLSPPPFHSISRDYFGTEEPKSSLGEAAIFATTLLSGVFAIIQMCGALGAF